MPRLHRLALLAALAVLFSSAASLAERVDLTEFLAPKPAVGDYRIYAWSRDGVVEAEERYDVAAVEERAHGWRVEWSHQGALYHAEIVRPGAKMRRATIDDNPVPGCRIALDYEVRACPLRFSVGRVRTFSRRSLGGPFPFPLIGLESRRGRYRLEGFAPVETPYASHDAAAVIASDVRVFFARTRGNGFRDLRKVGPWRFDGVDSRRSWYVAGVGIVGLRVQYEAGEPATEMWLREGLVQGVPYP